MRRIRSVVITLSILSVMAFGQSFAAREDAATMDAGSDAMTMHMARHDFKMSDLIDKRVKEKGGGDVGEIEDVMLSPDGRNNYAVLAGPYNKYYPIPMQALQRREADGPLYLDLTKEQVDRAPSFSKDNWDQLTGLQWEQNVMSYYGQQSQQNIQSSPDQFSPSSRDELSPGKVAPGQYESDTFSPSVTPDADTEGPDSER